MFQVDRGRVQAALQRAETASAGVPAGRVAEAASTGAAAVAGGELAAALGEVGPVLESRVRALGHAVEGWTAEVAAAVALYDASDADSQAGLDRLAWEAV